MVACEADDNPIDVLELPDANVAVAVLIDDPAEDDRYVAPLNVDPAEPDVAVAEVGTPEVAEPEN